MRLLILTADYPPYAWSGIAYAVEAQARALAEAGVDVHVVVGRSGRAFAFNRHGPQLHRLDRSRFPVDPRGFDRVHLHSLSLAELCLELRRRFGVPMTYTAHSLLSRELDFGPESNHWIRLQRELFRLSDCVVLLSESERVAASQALPDPAQAVVIGNGVPPAPTHVRRRRRLGPIVFAGRFSRTKGLDLLSELLPRLMRRGPWRAVIAGGHGDASSLRAIRRLRTSLGERCRIPGWLPRPRLQTLLGGAGLLLMPSAYEPFGLLALEAMRLGTPVLASSTGGLAEIITADSGGRLARVNDVPEWTDRASEILESPDVWTALHKSGPPYVAERFQMRGIAERLLREAYA
jgi:glycosyltransferase involved in cell wall biosynthesis